MVTQKIARIYSLRKSKQIFRKIQGLYLRKAASLDPAAKEKLHSHLTSLQKALLKKDASIAHRIAKQVEESSQKLIQRSLWDKTLHFIGALGTALLIAILIRQTWFEFYSIPTGSMRPTLKEQDYLVVNKTSYGMNVPLNPSHFYFDPSLVQRGDIVVFTSAGLDMPDAETVYFYLFPGKKQLVKRLIGKPGDTLYFYGGQIYGIDAQGRELTAFRQSPAFQSLEHIPFIRFEGRVEPIPPSSGQKDSALVFYQMNQPVAKLSVNPYGLIRGEMISESRSLSSAKSFSDLWGMGNYAMARLLSEEQLRQIHPEVKDLSQGALYLELTHHPTFHTSLFLENHTKQSPHGLAFSSSLIPLEEPHLEVISQALITCRFTVKQGVACRLGSTFDKTSPYLPKMSGVPDGTYEFQKGIAYEILRGGRTRPLPKDHPIYPQDVQSLQKLFNLGFEMSNFYTPSLHSPLLPSRYAYFRNQDLYLMGAPILQKDDPALTLHFKREYQKQSTSTSQRPYIPFDDRGPPFTPEGSLDTQFIYQFGLRVPEKMYLVLGDNHAMSGDSRQFGFVPEHNLKGKVAFLFWPSGSRWGWLTQPDQSLFTLPNLLIWGSASFLICLYGISRRRALQTPLPLDKKKWGFRKRSPNP